MQYPAVLHYFFSLVMKWYWVRTRWFIKKLFPGYVWDMPGHGKTVYLTFDDGPTPEITEYVLATLARYEIKATFFCIGNNIGKHPDIFRKVVEGGHTIGNHTFNHLNGWNTGTPEYLENVAACESSIKKHSGMGTPLFRPPYGKIKRAQAKRLKNLGYKMIMWDVLSADFDRTITPEQCLDNVTANCRPGSIVIFHDSVKAAANMEYALPRALEFLKEKGYDFGTL